MFFTDVRCVSSSLTWWMLILEPFNSTELDNVARFMSLATPTGTIFRWERFTLIQSSALISPSVQESISNNKGGLGGLNATCANSIQLALRLRHCHPTATR